MSPDRSRREMSIRLAEQDMPQRIAREWEAACTRIAELEHQLAVLHALLAHARDVESNLADEFAAVTMPKEIAA